jgi:hypothetical protein
VNRLFPPTSKRAGNQTRVQDKIEELAASGGMFGFEQRESHVSVRGRFGHSAFVKHGREIVCLLMSARKARAEGDVCILGEGVFLGYGVSLGGGRAEIFELSEEEVQNASMSPELDVISGYFTIEPSKTKVEPSPPAGEERKAALLELPNSKPNDGRFLPR